jgi:hypothetical protein
MNDANTNACPAGSSKITDFTTCQTAAAFLGRMFSGSSIFSSLLFPSGCYLSYLDIATSFVYFNIHPTGAAASGAQPLCRVTGAPPATAAPAHLRGTPWAEYPAEEYRVSAVVT